MIRLTVLLAGLICAGVSASIWAVDKVSLYALFNNKAIVLVDGAHRLLSTGEVSPEGVKLISADPATNQAVVEFDGKRQELKLNAIISPIQNTRHPTVTIYAGANGFFRAQGSVNDFPVTFIVDTGANVVAMNASLAKQIGLDYRDSEASLVKTASGFARAYTIELDKVAIGGIVIRNVEASVIDGPQPDTPLLGMSFLGNLEMQRDGNQMELTQKY